ncbi:B1 protein-like [Diabrotica undecimpunctata]|uniref:B1 protein-like n=1 Tax=Diabrotica undecimpunctata TaxID=50387 RepID=UPI003B638CB7
MYRVIVSVFVLFITAKIAAHPLDLKDFKQEVIELTKVLHDECVAKTGVNEQLIEKAKEGIFEDDVKFKKYLSCCWVTSAVMEKSGKLNEDMLVGFIPPEYKNNIMQAVTTCQKKFADLKPLHNMVFEMEKCMYTASPEMFVMF